MHTGDCVVTEGCGRVQVPPTYPSPPASLSWSAPGPSPLRAEFGAQPSLLPGGAGRRLSHLSQRSMSPHRSGLQTAVACVQNQSHETNAPTGCKLRVISYIRASYLFIKQQAVVIETRN